jgi:hypothetical protein
MNRIAIRFSAALLAPAIAITPAHADGPAAARSTADEQAAFDADRAGILAMAGSYKVRFDMQETTPWMKGYTPLNHKISGGNEVVRVIGDTGRKIMLQHMLVIERDGKTHVIKHWRQDWEYEPARVLVYSAPNTWKWDDVPEKMRHGRWSQTVYQVDDSPRYAGWGEFTTVGGVRRWRSNWTWRPLARRDAVRHPVYDRYLAINRHQNTPDGWIHWQDNMKMGLVGGKLTPIVQESVLNTYARFDGYNVKAADDYWTATKAYWAAVRAEWDKVATARGGIGIKEEAETGTVVSARLLEMANFIQDGTMKQAAAIAEARRLIEGSTRTL